MCHSYITTSKFRYLGIVISNFVVLNKFTLSVSLQLLLNVWHVYIYNLIK